MSAVMRRIDYREGEGMPPASQALKGVYIAMRIALKYQHRTPTVDELRADFGMSRSNAYRWRGAFLAAKGQP